MQERRNIIQTPSELLTHYSINNSQSIPTIKTNSFDNKPQHASKH